MEGEKQLFYLVIALRSEIVGPIGIPLMLFFALDSHTAASGANLNSVCNCGEDNKLQVEHCLFPT